MGKSTKIVKEGKTYKAKATKDVYLEEKVEKLKQALDENLSTWYQDMRNMREMRSTLTLIIHSLV